MIMRLETVVLHSISYIDGVGQYTADIMTGHVYADKRANVGSNAGG